jgi:YD repeat-containing protein
MGTTITTQFLLVTYDPGSLFAMWLPAQPVAGLTGYRIFVQPPTGAAQTFDAGVNATTLKIPVTITDQTGYTISIAVLVDGEPGPQSTPLALITSAAFVLSMVYDEAPAARLSLLWRGVNQTGVSGYVVVLDEVGTSNQWTATPTDPQAVFSQKLDTAYAYQATIRATGSDGMVQGPITAPLTAITASTQILLMAYDESPAARLSLTWQPVNNSLVTGYVAVLNEVGTSNQWTSTPNDPQTQFDTRLDVDHTYSATVRATGNNGVVQGPATAPLTAITAPTQVLSMVYDTAPSTVLTLLWVAVNQGPVTGYVAVLSESGTTNQWIATPADAHTQFTQELKSAHDYRVTVRATGNGGVVQGPATTPLTAITASAQIQSMTYNVTPTAMLTLTWQAVVQAAVTGYVAVLDEVSTSNQWTETPSTPQAEFSQKLDTKYSYRATVRATGANGVVQGPATPPLTAISAAPVLSELDYNPNNFIVSWAQIAGDTVTGYDVTVALGAQTTIYPAGKTGQTTLSVALDPAKSYTVVACATGAGGIVKGPPSLPLTPLLSSPTRPALAFTGSAFNASWTADSAPSVTGYIVQLLSNGTVADEKTPAASPATFSDPLNAGTVYASRVRSSGDKVKGPWTVQAPGPYRSLATLTYDGLGRLTTIARANAETTAFTFDAFGNIETVRNTAPGP